jgi:Xaa-Pro aminopeptidase
MSSRADRLTARLEELGVDRLIVSDLVNIRYLTGFTGSSAVVVLGGEQRLFITDSRYVTQAREQVEASFERCPPVPDLLSGLAEAMDGAGALRVGFEEAHLTVRGHRRLAERLGERVTLVAVEAAVEPLRRVKDGEEISRIRAAAALADDALAGVLAEGLAGRTERDVALALEVAMRQRGAQRPSFDTIVASGPHGALPHASPRDVPIEKGQLVTIDWGAELDGYCSDCTRTVGVGAVDDHAREIHALVLAAERAGLAALAAGRTCAEVDATAREVILAAGHGEHFGHGLGHGVGLDVHEAPRLSGRSEEILGAGDVVTVEPGVYLPDRLGVRIEDLVLVGETGTEVLSSHPADLQSVE